MVFPHPASRKHTQLGRFIWRYFTGHHLDGKARTNATWFKRGTAPHHHLNWWSAKPRAHRMLWRWSMFLVPIIIFIGYHLAPSFRINLVSLILLSGLPYGFHHVTQKLLALVPQTKVVFVQNTVPMDHVDAEIDPISDYLGSVILK